MNLVNDTIIPLLGFYEPISSISHLLAAILMFYAGYRLIIKGFGNYIRVISLAIYSLSAIFLFTMSGLYHMLPPGIAKQVFIRLDYIGIWILIAGSFTPIHIILFRKKWRWLVLMIIWGLALIGVTFTALFAQDIPAWLMKLIFCVFGGIGAISSYRIYKLYGWEMLKPVVIGGLIYFVGVYMDIKEFPVIISGVLEHHELFHFFVIAGAAFHWYFIYKISHEPTKDFLMFHVIEDIEGTLLAKGKFEPIRIKSKNIETLKTLIKEEINFRYHPVLKPQRIYFRFFKEDSFKIK